MLADRRREKTVIQHTPWEVSSALSPRASLAAEARVPREASESLATLLLASLLAPLAVSWTVSLT